LSVDFVDELNTTLRNWPFLPENALFWSWKTALACL